MGNVSWALSLLKSRSSRSIGVNTVGVGNVRAIPHALAVSSLLDNVGPLVTLAAEAPGTEENKCEDTEIAQLAEDDEEESEGLVGSARVVVDVAVDENELCNGEGVTDPDDGGDEHDEAGKR
jgi:hypothetical protein